MYNTIPVYSKGSINIYCNEKEKFKIDSSFSVMETNNLFPVDFTKLLEKSHQDSPSPEKTVDRGQPHGGLSWLCGWCLEFLL